MGFDLQEALNRIEKEKNAQPELRPEERIKGPYQIPLSQVNKRSRVGAIAHAAAQAGWDAYVYECINYTGDTLMKSGGVKRGKEEAYTWTVAKTRRDGIYYVIKYSDLVCWINKVGCSYDELRQFIAGQQSERDFLI
jgi:hypothetical protein